MQPIPKIIFCSLNKTVKMFIMTKVGQKIVRYITQICHLPRTRCKFHCYSLTSILSCLILWSLLSLSVIRNASICGTLMPRSFKPFLETLFRIFDILVMKRYNMDSLMPRYVNIIHKICDPATICPK